MNFNRVVEQYQCANLQEGHKATIKVMPNGAVWASLCRGGLTFTEEVASLTGAKAKASRFLGYKTKWEAVDVYEEEAGIVLDGLWHSLDQAGFDGFIKTMMDILNTDQKLQMIEYLNPKDKDNFMVNVDWGKALGDERKEMEADIKDLLRRAVVLLETKSK